LRLYGDSYRQTHPVSAAQDKVIDAIVACRTAQLGGHAELSPQCGFERYAYNSCRNRHGPKCQIVTKANWVEARRAELLPTPYFHTVMTLPHELNPLILGNKRLLLGLLFHTASDTLLQFGRTNLGGQLGAERRRRRPDLPVAAVPVDDRAVEHHADDVEHRRPLHQRGAGELLHPNEVGLEHHRPVEARQRDPAAGPAHQVGRAPVCVDPSGAQITVERDDVEVDVVDEGLLPLLPSRRRKDDGAVGGPPALEDRRATAVIELVEDAASEVVLGGQHDAVVVELVGEATQLPREPIVVDHMVERSDAPPFDEVRWPTPGRECWWRRQERLGPGK